MQLLLDHQLMDMAWSDNLIDCEESLLKASVHLQSTPNSSSSQGNPRYNKRETFSAPMYQFNLNSKFVKALHLMMTDESLSDRQSIFDELE